MRPRYCTGHNQNKSNNKDINKSKSLDGALMRFSTEVPVIGCGTSYYNLGLLGDSR